MNYVTGRVFHDHAGFIFREHRPGWIRRDGAPIVPATEHQIQPITLQYQIHPGILVIVEEPW